MIKKDFHTHTNYCDGKNTPEEMVLSAIEKGMTDLGFSGHTFVQQDSFGMTVEGQKRYIAEISELKEKYAESIHIYCGAEYDYESDVDCGGFEYLIGSVHYFEKDALLLSVDDTPEIFEAAVREHFGGDYYAAAENYYALVADVIERTGADIIGHFDLVTKYNEGGRLFDTSSPRYREAWMRSADRLLGYGKPFEINTGAIIRGYRTEPYPSFEIIDYIGTHGGSFILSSDSHSVSGLLYGFDELERYVLEKGFRLLR